MSLTKIDVVESVREKIGIPKKDCVRIVESLFDHQGQGIGEGIY